MRWLPVVLLLLLSIPPVPGQVQTAQAGPLVEDVAGDVRVDAVVGSQPEPQQVSKAVDLRSLTVTEDLDSFTFAIQVTDLKTGQDAVGEVGQTFYVDFRHAKRSFSLYIGHSVLAGTEDSYAYMYARDEDTKAQSFIAYYPAVADGEAETMSVTIPRADLADSRGAAPFPGRVLDMFHVQSRDQAGFFADLQDDMPDSGTATKAYEVQLGLRQEGHARLSSTEPFRASNGEATTFLFKANGTNIGENADTFHLRVKDVPTGWSVVLPVTTFDLGSEESHEFPIVATVPFNHAHGSAASFVLEMQSGTDPHTTGRLEMGVRYLTIPQPAGHHDTAWFHSRAAETVDQALGALNSNGMGQAFMDAAETLEGDDKVPLPPQGEELGPLNGSPQVGYSWCIPLDPGLQMGLDFDLQGKGNVSVPIQVTTPFNGAYLSATLFVTPPDYGTYYGCYIYGDATPIATLNATTPVDIAANSQAVLTGQLDIWRGADRIPYVKGQNLMLQVEAWGLGVPTIYGNVEKPQLAPGGQLTLPLLEYHDDVKQVLTTAHGPALAPLGPQERQANPGGLVDFPLSVANDGDTERVIAFNVSGFHGDWAELPTVLTVPAHDSARADLWVRVPAQSKSGDVADLVLQAYELGNETSRSLLRLVVVVDTDATYPDDAGGVATPGSKGSPVPSAVLLLAVLGLGARVGRRRSEAPPGPHSP